MIAAFACRRFIQVAFSLWKIAREVIVYAWPHRGFFAGERLETFICEKLRSSRKLAPFRAELEGQALTFGRVAQLRAAHPDDPRLEFVPLILTVTDLAKRELVLISSYDSRFADLPVAKAVRASAGFPVFFRPIDVDSGSLAGCYVDGGVIANYPAWIFSRQLRRSLSETATYRDLATRPWLNIGLRLVNDTAAVSATTPGSFIRAMFDMARGQIRNQLEKALSDALPRTLTIDQPRTRSGRLTKFWISIN